MLHRPGWQGNKIQKSRINARHYSVCHLWQEDTSGHNRIIEGCHEGCNSFQKQGLQNSQISVLQSMQISAYLLEQSKQLLKRDRHNNSAGPIFQPETPRSNWIKKFFKKIKCSKTRRTEVKANSSSLETCTCLWRQDILCVTDVSE